MAAQDRNFWIFHSKAEEGTMNAAEGSELPMVAEAVIAFIKGMGARSPEKMFSSMVEQMSSSGKGAELVLLSEDVFLVQEKGKEIKRKTELGEVVYCGIKLGTIRGEIFIPGPNFLNYMAAFLDELNYVIVNARAEWLFLCGRDIFAEGIVRKSLSMGNALVLNERRECLGYGRIETSGSQLIKNIFDLGDFLRRERKRR